MAIFANGWVLVKTFQMCLFTVMKHHVHCHCHVLFSNRIQEV